jgi:hypothetical protein
MAWEERGLDVSFKAAEDLSGHKYRFVHLKDDDEVDLLDSGTEYPIGILQNAPASGEAAVVRVTGISKLVMNDAVAVGAKLKAEYVGATDNGKGDAADTDGDLCRAICVMAAGAEDDVGTVLLCSDTISVPV